MHTRFYWGNPSEGNHLEDRSVDVRIILKWILEKWEGDMDWTDLAHDGDSWRAFVHVVINLRLS
jgi:hypothetical protein